MSQEYCLVVSQCFHQPHVHLQYLRTRPTLRLPIVTAGLTMLTSVDFGRMGWARLTPFHTIRMSKWRTKQGLLTSREQKTSTLLIIVHRRSVWRSSFPLPFVLQNLAFLVCTI
ncbi:hypothetical protein KC19_VG272700 [Ceratodon purpureus]|uniref:Uncharacterized protein n=1 Tax=Ceratodon purpureus TaxID=3225 RepID=A0A8T0HU58_CERPU|nr:hypothetical protein KC19_VG272700 [Ceratodon purpureus]